MKLVWLRKAATDQQAHISFIAQFDPHAAVEQGDRIEQQVDQLMLYPFLGRAGRVAGTRELVIARTHFIAVYRVKADRIEILRLLHTSQRWP